jgi:DNA-binding response OmpR family regulator
LSAFAAVLADEGLEIVPASSGQEALKLSLNKEFAVILLDVRMPEMDGIETATILRAGRARFTPIIFVSAHERTPLEVERGYLAGAIDYLYSPVDSEVLRRKVKALVAFYTKNLEYKHKAEALERTVQTLHERIRALGAGSPTVAPPNQPMKRDPSSLS